MYRAGKVTVQKRGASILKESIDNLGTKMAGDMEVIA